MTTTAEDRATHWIRANHQNRVPKRWVAFDTESRSAYDNTVETQTWAMGAGIRWREDLATGDHAEAETFDGPLSFWQWVTDYCKPRMRTVAMAHNLGHDIRISQAFEILPQLGWRLEWCNLDRNVSAMTWRGPKGTLVLADTWTWLPMPLATVAPTVGLRKLAMPPDNAKHYRWERYCMRDAEIVYRVMKELIGFIRSEDLGNWQPTGAGMSYATWRHKFMTHKILVHDDERALSAERKAMHTGRAEAWQHGELLGSVYTEADMTNAYVTIAAECELPTKIKFHLGAIGDREYSELARHYRVLGRCDVATDNPVVPYYNGTRTIWPVGNFQTWLWDTEIDLARREHAGVKVREAYVYTRAPILQAWAVWVLSILRSPEDSPSPVVKTWIKHCSRALIGRLSLKVTRWDYFGSNPFDVACVTHVVDAKTGKTHRMMHVGNRSFEETGAVEGRDSLPQVTGWIMAECRVRLWEAMRAAGLAHLVHVDTDSLLVDRAGLAALRAAQGESWGAAWQLKGSWRRMIVYGPRNYRAGRTRKAAGVPRKATETLPNVFHGERWQGVSASLEAAQSHAVTVWADTWTLNGKDSRRNSASGASTCAIEVQEAASSVAAVSSSGSSGAGE